MTLVLTHASPSYVVQVTDRLVTRNSMPIDPVANKNVIYRARDGIVSIGYTGLAYLGELTTDQWIAKKLAGQQAASMFGNQPSLTFSKPKQLLELGQAIDLLREELDATFSQMRASDRRWPHIVQVAGWQWDKSRKRTRPTLALIQKTRGLGAFEIERAPRYWHFRRDQRSQGRTLLLTTPPDYLTLAEANDLADRLNNRLPDEVEDVLVGAVRTVSSRTSTVGADCIAILMARPHLATGPVRVRFIPKQVQHGLPTIHLPSDTPTSFGYSPWILGPDVVVPPLRISGSGMQVPLRGIVISVEAPPTTPGRQITFWMEGQQRPPRP